MSALGFIIIIVLIFLVFYAVRREEFTGSPDGWPVPSPEELGAPTPPGIMRIAERVATGEIVAPTTTQPKDKSDVGPQYNFDISLGGQQYPMGMQQYGYPTGLQQYGYPAGVSQYGPYGYPPGMQQYGQYGRYNPLEFGGNSSGSTAFGAFGPQPPSALYTLAQTGQAGQNVLPSAETVPSMQPSVQPTPLSEGRSVSASATGRETRARTIAEEADIQGFDWSGAAASASQAFEPAEVYQAPQYYAPAVEEGPFQTVAAATIQRTMAQLPNVTATTAVSLPRSADGTLLQNLNALNQQKLMQASFGSVSSPAGSPFGLSTGLSPFGTVGPSIDMSGQQSGLRYDENGNVVVSMGMPTPMFGQSGQGMFGQSGQSGLSSMFGQSGQSGQGQYNQGPVFASTTSAVRGSKNQPGGGMPDSKSTQTVVDTGPGQVVVQSLQPAEAQVSQSTVANTAAAGMSA